MRAKLGLTGEDPGDAGLVRDLLALLGPTDGASSVDWTSFWRLLSQSLVAQQDPLADTMAGRHEYAGWRGRWLARLGGDAQLDDGERHSIAADMDAVNPLYVPRNHLVEDALGAARVGELGPFETLVAAVSSPYVERPGLAGLTAASPEGFDRSYVTYCGT